MTSPVASLPLHRRIVPPAYLLAAIVLMVALDRYVPVMDFETSALRWVGGVTILAGVGLAAWGATTFRRAGTPVRPFEEATALVTVGPFRWTRNPMYLGMLAVLAGTWLALGSLVPLFVLPAFYLLIRHWFIGHEEAAMAERFGERFGDYCRRVRRWV
ncbi:MAG TPA: isoprenylcysteine carboxylmethyltransferase family protein [Gammaproteobacteria bacterium]|jgi:protein-S-isoprenylcysteine O-methyltransferase Ste14